MPTSKPAKSSNHPSVDTPVIQPSELTAGDLVRFNDKRGEEVYGRVLRHFNIPAPGCMIGPCDSQGVRLLRLAVAWYDNEGYLIERNGKDALF